MKKRGGAPEFCIVAAGPNAAEPHHLSDETVIQEGDVLILDFGCDVAGYKSDITRTVCVGKAASQAKEVYALVYEAHMAARKAIVRGATGESVDRAARTVIEKGGYGDLFFHRTGHGIGTSVHEEPNIVTGNTRLLVPGNCFSIEPGVYIAGKFGVRIENIVAATADGHDSMNVDPSPTLIETD
jgi:Xaa-Pro aminopeptidase